MSMIKKATLLVAISIFVSNATALATEPIVGAWGVKLGQVWTDKTRPDEDRSNVYSFTPSKPTPRIHNYEVVITPETNIVGSIVGWSVICLKDKILPHLEKKYGDAEHLIASDFINMYEISSANRSVSISCTTGYGSTIDYSDAEIIRLRKEEEEARKKVLMQKEDALIEDSDL